MDLIDIVEVVDSIDCGPSHLCAHGNHLEDDGGYTVKLKNGAIVFVCDVCAIEVGLFGSAVMEHYEEERYIAQCEGEEARAQDCADWAYWR